MVTGAFVPFIFTWLPGVGAGAPIGSMMDCLAKPRFFLLATSWFLKLRFFIWNLCSLKTTLHRKTKMVFL